MPLRWLIALASLAVVFAGAVTLSGARPDVADAHRSGCHAWHTRPSDTGSYQCGDTGHGCNYGADASSPAAPESDEDFEEPLNEELGEEPLDDELAALDEELELLYEEAQADLDCRIVAARSRHTAAADRAKRAADKLTAAKQASEADVVGSAALLVPARAGAKGARAAADRRLAAFTTADSRASAAEDEWAAAPTAERGARQKQTAGLGQCATWRTQRLGWAVVAAPAGRRGVDRARVVAAVALQNCRRACNSRAPPSGRLDNRRGLRGGRRCRRRRRRGQGSAGLHVDGPKAPRRRFASRKRLRVNCARAPIAFASARAASSAKTTTKSHNVIHEPESQ
jgi:hypothetical protein